MTRPCRGAEPARTPKLQAPPGACDTHAHVIGPFDRFPLHDDRSYTPPPALLDDYLAMLTAIGVERGVVVQPSIYGTDNRCMVDALQRAGERLRGVAVVSEDIDDSELRRLDDAGVRGIRFNLLYAGGVGLEILDGLAARIAGFGWHVQLLLDARRLPELAGRLAALPVDIVFDHMGHLPTSAGTGDPGFRALLAMMESGRCWTKLSGDYRISSEGPPYRDAIPFARALAAANPERCLWGSDWPHVAIWPEAHMPNDADLLDALLEWVPDGTARRHILVDNPATLYRFA